MSKFKPWRTYSIFISSTFADMQAERDHLKNIVLPKIKEELQKKRIKLEIVDLRWGLDTTSIEQEDEREVTVLKVCLDEIKRCKPFFICLMGDRYGWIPPEKRMDDATIGMDHITHHKGKSVTALEIEFGVLASQEQLVRSVFYFRDTLDYTKLTPERAAMFSDAHNPFLTEKEKKERGKALKKLKSSITSHFNNKEIKDKVKSYTVDWEAQKEKVINLEAWGEMVYEDIINDCIAHAQYTIGSAPKNWQEKELALLDSFIENHTVTFCGRKELLDELKEHLLLKDPNNWGLILTGESGSGKSAVFSMINKIMQQEDCFILSHSTGLSAKSRNILDLLQIWNKQLSDFLGIEYIELKPQAKTVILDNFESDNERIQQAEPKPEIEKIQEKFKELLFTVAEQTQVVLLIDALDRFEPTQRAQYMTWLPTIMPGNIRMLCTAITGTEKNAIEYHSELLVSSIDFFTSEEAKLMLNMLCNLQHKSIPVKVEKVILEKKRDDGLVATSSPLWLSLAVNILMAMDNDDFEKMKQLEGRGDEQIADYMETLAEDFPALPGNLFLSLLTKAASVFGEVFTWKTFNYIACSRDGLRESDLEKLIPKTKDENWDALLFANLRRWFNKHLREEGEDMQWNLVHSILRNSLLKEIKKKATTSIHNSIASHILTLPASDELRISETMYHLMEAENAKDALDYYISDITSEEIDGATGVLAEVISSTKKGMSWVLSLTDATDTDTEKIWKLAPRFIYNLNSILALDGNLGYRKKIFEELIIFLLETNVNYETNAYCAFNLGDLYGKLGQINQDIGKYGNALSLFTDYNLLMEELYKSNGEERIFINSFALSNSKLGYINQALGRFDSALTYFNKYNELMKVLYENNSQNENIKKGLANSYGMLGDFNIRTRKFKNAHSFIKEATNLFEELCRSNSQNIDYKNGLALSYEKLGDINKAFGEFNQALIYFKDYNKLMKEIYGSHPKNDDIKINLAFSYEKLGVIYQKLNDLDIALKNLNKEVTLFKKLVEDNPKNEDYKIGLGISYEKLGEVYQSLGRHNDALNYYKKEQTLFIKIYKNNPNSDKAINGLAASYGKLAMLNVEIGQVEKAVSLNKEALVLFIELYENNPENKRNIDNLTVMYTNLGGNYENLGEFELALLYFRKKALILQDVSQSNPEDDNCKNTLAISYSKLGDIYNKLNKPDRALQCFIDEELLFEQLYTSNPDNKIYINNLIISCSKIETIYRNLSDFNKALPYTYKEVSLYEALNKRNPNNEETKQSLAISYEKLGTIYSNRNEFDKALLPFQNEVTLFEELFNNNPKDENLKKRLANSYSILGGTYQALNEFDQALPYFSTVVTLYNELYKSDPNNPNLFFGLGVSFYKLGLVYKALNQFDTSKGLFISSVSIFEQLYKVTKQDIYKQHSVQIQNIIEELQNAGY